MNLQINVNGVNRTNYVLWKTFNKIDNLNYQVDICSFSTRKYGAKSWKPVVGDEVEVVDNDIKKNENVVLIDNYSETNYSDSASVYFSSLTRCLGQSFLNINRTILDSGKFYLKKKGSPTGNATVSVYAHIGTYGVNGKPTGSALATSDNFDVSTLTTSNQLITFTFSGANRITLSPSTYYVLMLTYASGNGENNILCGLDTTSPTHSGNCSYSADGSTWGATDSYDVCFYIYGIPLKIFAGVIITITEEQEGALLLRYNVVCKDWTHYLDKKLVVERYTSTPISGIINDIILTYAPTFTVAGVNCSLIIKSIAFNYISVSEAIQMLAEAVNYSWYVDYNKDIHFFTKNVEIAPFNLEDDSGNFVNESLVLTDDLSQLRNLVLIRGGDKIGNAITEYKTGDGKTVHFPLANKFSEKPTVTIGGVAKTVGTEYLNLDTDYDCLWNFNEKYIRFTAGVTTPISGTPIGINGTPLIPILVQVQDDFSILLYGQYEFKKIDKSIKTVDEARQYAIAQLEAYRIGVKEGSFQTYTSGLRSGQVIRITSTLRGIDETFIIQSVNLKVRGYNEGIWSVELATLRTVGIIDFLQKLLLDETKKITISENEVLEKFYMDYKNIGITELIEVKVAKQDNQNIGITELIRKDPFTVVWVLSEYFPQNDSDPKRNMCLDISSFLY